jgi:hypothetical protein
VLMDSNTVENRSGSGFFFAVENCSTGLKYSKNEI